METEETTGYSEFSRQVEEKERRKLRAKQKDKRTVWHGFGMFGLIGWSVVVPTLLGALLGLWIDKHYPGKHSYTLALLVAGLALGCFNAWHWVNKEMNDMQQDQDNQTTDDA